MHSSLEFYIVQFARYIDGSVVSRGSIISILTHEGSVGYVPLTQKRDVSGGRFWPREQIFPDQNITPFPLVSFFSPYSCAHQRGTNVREACYRRTRECGCHDHGLSVGTWATVCRLSFLRRGRLSIFFSRSFGTFFWSFF